MRNVNPVNSLLQARKLAIEAVNLVAEGKVVPNELVVNLAGLALDNIFWFEQRSLTQGEKGYAKKFTERKQPKLMRKLSKNYFSHYYFKLCGLK